MTTMRVLVVAAVAALAGCGADEQLARAPVDASDVDGRSPPEPPESFPCDPVAQTGCGPGLRCTWVQLAGEPEAQAGVGCRPDGSIPEGGTCQRGPAGLDTGIDDCVAGTVCVAGRCLAVCDFEQQVRPCAAGHACARFAGVFEDGGGDAFAGACEVSCDPLTQTVDGGGTCGEGRGCYLVRNPVTTVAACARAGTATHGQPVAGTPPLANACAPGHVPRRTGPDQATFACTALCRPNDVYQGTNESDEGGVAPDTCVARGASPPSDPDAGESCRYWWTREPVDAALSAFSNTVGWCHPHATWTYDSDRDGELDAPSPRCPTLPRADAAAFGCVARSAAPAWRAGPIAAEPLADRVR